MSASFKRKHYAAAAAIAVFTGVASAADAPAASSQNTDLSAELNALKARIAQLESEQHENWLTKERESQIRGIVDDVLKDARARGQFADGVETGYKDGFYIQTPDKNFKLTVGGFAQIRYTFAQTNAYNGRTLPARNGGGTNNVTPGDPGDASGFDVRRARVNFAGNVFSPDLTYKLEGDFYGNATGNFTVTDAFVAYRFNDQFRVKVGSFKVPFAKAELTADTVGTFPERPEVLAPFDPIRSLGVSLYGDIIKDKLSYEVNVNDGSQANTLRRVDTVGSTANLDNRPGIYARVQWAGNGKIPEFAEEADLRDDNREFIWLLGAAGGYESQNSTNNAFPSPQSSDTLIGLPNGVGNNSPFGTAALNGDIYRATIDWSAKWQGLSLNTAAYFQQVNSNEGQFNTATSGGNPTTVSPFSRSNSSFFQWGGYGQVGYFVLPQKLELTGRVGLMATEGYPDRGEFYSVGANYYVFKNNFKIQTDLTYTPEAAYTDSAASLLANTHDVVLRVQLQLKF